MAATGPRVRRITATPAAREAVKRLCAVRGGPVMFVQSGGCCAGSIPMCYPAGEFITGPRDMGLGEVEGCPFYIDAALDDALGHPGFILDVEDGEPEEFSLGAGPGRHFVTHTAACSLPTGRAAGGWHKLPRVTADTRIAESVLARGGERGAY